MATAEKTRTITVTTSSGTTKWELRIAWVINWQDAETNKSSITVAGSLKSLKGSFTSSMNQQLQIHWHDLHDNTDVTLGTVSTKTIKDGATLSIKKTVHVTHNADGNLSGEARVVWGKSGFEEWVPNSQQLQTDRKAFPRIERESTLYLDDTFDVDDGFSMVIEPVKSTYRHWIWLNAQVDGVGFSHRLAAITDNVKTSFDWLPTDSQIAEIMSAIPNKTSLSATLTVRTYDENDQKVGIDTVVTLTITVPNSFMYRPLVTQVGMTEINDSISPYISSVNDVVKILSKKSISITIDAVNYSTLKKVSLTNGTQVKNLTIGTPTTVNSNKRYTWTVQFTNLTAVGFKLSATDSRGFTTTDNYFTTGTLYNYSIPQFTDVRVFREPIKSSDAFLNVYGKWWKSTIGSTANTLTIGYKFNNASSWTYIISNQNVANPFTYEDTAISTSATYSEDYPVQIYLKDKFGTAQTFTVTLPSSRAVLWLGKSTVRASEHLVVEGFDPTISMKNLSGTPELVGYDFYAFRDRLQWRYYGDVGANATKSFTFPVSTGARYLVGTFGSTAGMLDTMWIINFGLARMIGEGFSSSTAFTYSSGYAKYDTNENYAYRRNGTVTLHLVIKPTADVTWGNTETQVALIPVGFRPIVNQRRLGQGSAKNNFYFEIRTSGAVMAARYGTTEYIQTPSGAWLNFDCTYMGGDGWITVSSSTSGFTVANTANGSCAVYVCKVN